MNFFYRIQRIIFCVIVKFSFWSNINKILLTQFNKHELQIFQAKNIYLGKKEHLYSHPSLFVNKLTLLRRKSYMQLYFLFFCFDFFIDTIKIINALYHHIIGQNGHLPLSPKTSSKMSMFWNYLAKCIYFETRFLKIWVSMKNLI